MELIYIVKENDLNKSINEILATNFHFSTRLKNKLIRNHNIFINGFPADTRLKASLNDKICIDLNFEEDISNIVSTKMFLDIVYEDEWFLVINKPAGIATHPSILHYSDSLSNGVRYYFDSIGLKKKIRPINRLDLGTSGLIVFAKCEYIQEELIKQMEQHIFKKVYLCVVHGHFEQKDGAIDLPIARESGSIIKRCVDKNGQKAITNYHVIKEFDNFSLVECSLETGRTHQIRVHMSAIGHPLLGDSLYGNPKSEFDYQILHSYKIEFIHPISKKMASFTASLPNSIFSYIS